MKVLDLLIHRHQSLCKENGIAVTREEAFGQLLAQFCQYERERILKAFAAALEDSGLFAEAQNVRMANGK